MEDKGLGALNELVWGAPKLWLIFPNTAAADKLRDVLKSKMQLTMFYQKKLEPFKIPLKTALECGAVPFVQHPGMVIYTAHGIDAMHVTVSSGTSFALASNCYYGPDLSQHFEDIRKKGEDPGYSALNLDHHQHVEDHVRKSLLLSKLGQ